MSDLCHLRKPRMTGVYCQLAEDKLEYLRVHLKKITIKGSLLKLMSNSYLSLCHHLRSDLKFELNIVYGDPMLKYVHIHQG